MDEERELLLTPRQVCEWLHIHPNTLRRWSDKGQLKAYRIGPKCHRRFVEREVRNFLSKIN